MFDDAGWVRRLRVIATTMAWHPNDLHHPGH